MSFYPQLSQWVAPPTPPVPALPVTFFPTQNLPMYALAPTAALTGRNKYLQPFTSTSIWNTPIGDGAVLSPTVFGTFYGDTGPSWGVQQDPSVMFMNNDVTGDLSRSTRRLTFSSPSGTVKVPIPATLPNNGGGFYFNHTNTQGSQGNQSSAIVSSDGNTFYQGNFYTSVPSTGDATATNRATTGEPFYLDGDGRFGSHGGSGLSALGGHIRKWEAPGGVLGPINHALVLEFSADDWYYSNLKNGAAPPYTTADYVWPANRADSYHGSASPNGYDNTAANAQYIQPGALLTLSTADYATLLATVTSPNARRLLDALYCYGGYIVDDGFTNNMTIGTEFGVDFLGTAPLNRKTATGNLPDGSSSTNFVAQMLSIFHKLRAVTNNYDGTDATLAGAVIGGGGNLRAPVALPLGTEFTGAWESPVPDPLTNRPPTFSGLITANVFTPLGRFPQLKTSWRPAPPLPPLLPTFAGLFITATVVTALSFFPQLSQWVAPPTLPVPALPVTFSNLITLNAFSPLSVFPQVSETWAPLSAPPLPYLAPTFSGLITANAFNPLTVFPQARNSWAPPPPLPYLAPSYAGLFITAAVFTALSFYPQLSQWVAPPTPPVPALPVTFSGLITANVFTPLGRFPQLSTSWAPPPAPPLPYLAPTFNGLITVNVFSPLGAFPQLHSAWSPPAPPPPPNLTPTFNGFFTTNVFAPLSTFPQLSEMWSSPASPPLPYLAPTYAGFFITAVTVTPLTSYPQVSRWVAPPSPPPKNPYQSTFSVFVTTTSFSPLTTFPRAHNLWAPLPAPPIPARPFRFLLTASYPPAAAALRWVAATVSVPVGPVSVIPNIAPSVRVDVRTPTAPTVVAPSIVPADAPVRVVPNTPQQIAANDPDTKDFL